MNNHTPEPWIPSQHLGTHILDTTDRCIADAPIPNGMPFEEGAANKARIVACVNGCKGIADPETTVPELIEALRFVAKQPTDQTASPQQCSMVAVAMDALAKLNA
jgi:hypothetical protein